MQDTRTGHDPSSRTSARPSIPAQDARAGEIILKSRRKRAIFISGLVGFALLVLVLSIAGLV